MTLNIADTAGEFVADGAGTPHTLGFQLFKTTDLVVEADGVSQIAGTDYSISGVYPAQQIVSISPHWVAGAIISYRRETPRQQEYEIPSGVDLRAKSLEGELDRNVMIQQEQDRELARTLKVASGDTPPAIGAYADGQIAAFVDGELVGVDSDIGSTAEILAAASASEADRVLSEAAASAVFAAIDGLTDAIPIYTTEALGLAGVADGEQFLVAPTIGSLHALYVRVDASNMRAMGWRAPSASGVAVLSRMVKMRTRADRPEYEWFFGNHYDGRFVANTGSYGDIQPEPLMVQLLGGAAIAFDGDGGATGVRLVWPSNVTNSLGFDEVIQVGLDASNRDFSFLYKFDFNDGIDYPERDLRAYVSLKTKLGGTDNNVFMGVDSTNAATRVDIATTSSYALHTVDLPAYGAGTDTTLTIGPDIANTPTYPIEFDIEYIGVAPAGVLPPALSDLRDFYLSGHAMPAVAAGNVNISGNAFRPSGAVPNMVASLRPEVITSSHWTFYIDLDLAQFDEDEAYAMSYGYEDRNDSDIYTLGGMLIGGGDPLVSEYSGRLTPRCGGDANQGITTPADTQLWGAGLVRIDVFAAGIAAECRQNNGQATGNDDQRWGYLINGCPESEYPVNPYPADFVARMMWLGGKDVNTSKAQAAYTGRNIRSPFYLARYRPNIPDVISRERIQAEIDFDRDELGIVLPKAEFALGILGDSTSRFSGNPHRWVALNKRGYARRFSNLSQGGMFYDHAGSLDGSQKFNNDLAIDFRVDYFKGHKAQETKRGIYLSHGGENNSTHLTFISPEQAIEDYAALAPAEAAEHCPGVFTHAIVSVRPSGVGGTAGRVAKDAFNAELRTRFSVQVSGSNPYLFEDPAYDGTGFKYMIDLDAWPPRHLDYGLTYTDWDDLLTNDTGPGKNNKVLSGDYQHWAGTDGGKYAALDVFGPCYEDIAAAEWGYAL